MKRVFYLTVAYGLALLAADRSGAESPLNIQPSYSGKQGKISYNWSINPDNLITNGIEDIHLHMSAIIHTDGKPKPNIKVTPLIRCAIEDEQVLIVQFPEATTDANGFISARIDERNIPVLIDENFNLGMCKALGKIDSLQFDIDTTTYTGSKSPSYTYGQVMQLAYLDPYFYNRSDVACGYTGDSTLYYRYGDALRSISWVIANNSAQGLTKAAINNEAKGKISAILIANPTKLAKSCRFGSLLVSPNPSAYDANMNGTDLKAKCAEAGAECWHFSKAIGCWSPGYANGARDSSKWSSSVTPKANEVWVRKIPNTDNYVCHKVKA